MLSIIYGANYIGKEAGIPTNGAIGRGNGGQRDQRMGSVFDGQGFHDFVLSAF